MAVQAASSGCVASLDFLTPLLSCACHRVRRSPGFGADAVHLQAASCTNVSATSLVTEGAASMLYLNRSRWPGAVYAT